MVTNASELITDVKAGGSVGCSDHALMEMAVLGDVEHGRSRIRTLNFRKANLEIQINNKKGFYRCINQQRKARKCSLSEE